MVNYNELLKAIYERKSVRDYTDERCEVLENENLSEFFGVVPLSENFKYEVKVLRDGEVKNKRSSYCIGFFGEDKPFAAENIGFIGQQISLGLHSLGLGTCWWGFKKPNKEFKKIDGLDCFITMSAGYPKEPLTRSYPEGFSRKSFKEIAGDIPFNPYIEAARIAPSAVNTQPWLIEKRGDSYLFRMAKAKGVIGAMLSATSFRNIDLGISAAHFFVAAKADGKDVRIEFTVDGLQLTVEDCAAKAAQ